MIKNECFISWHLHLQGETLDHIMQAYWPDIAADLELSDSEHEVERGDADGKVFRFTFDQCLGVRCIDEAVLLTLRRAYALTGGWIIHNLHDLGSGLWANTWGAVDQSERKIMVRVGLQRAYFYMSQGSVAKSADGERRLLPARIRDANDIPLQLGEIEKRELCERYHDIMKWEEIDAGQLYPDRVAYIDSSLETLLHIAAREGNARAVELLLNGGANPNQLADMSYTPLHEASSEEVARLLIAHGASPAMRTEFGELPK